MSLSAERQSRRHVVIAEAARGNNYGVLSAYVAGLAAELRARGFDVELARASDACFLGNLLRRGDDQDAIALLGHFFYDLRVFAQNHFSSARIGDLFRGRMLAMWADHPFTTFMWPRLQEADPRCVYAAADPGFVGAARLLNPQLTRCQVLGLPVLYAPTGPWLPQSRRPIDVLVPLTLRDVPDRKAVLAAFGEKSALQQRVAQALFQVLADDRLHYPLDLALPILAAEAGVTAGALAADKSCLRQWYGVLSAVDLAVRNERRVQLLTDLLRQTSGLRVQVVGRLPAGLALPPGTTHEGALDARVLGERMAQARWVVHGHPTYPHAMHERVLTAMAAGCGVISDFAPALASAFLPGKHWVVASQGASLNELTADFDDDALAAMAAEAAALAQFSHGMPVHVDALLSALDNLGQR